MGPRVPAAPLTCDAKCLEVENRSYFYSNLSKVVCAPVVFLPTPGERGWRWGGLSALAGRRRRAEIRGIGRLTSDIGLRPSARCPAGRRCGGGRRSRWLLSTETIRWDRGRRGTASHIAPHAAQSARLPWELVQGSLPLLKTIFGKLSPTVG